jgi:hypothetical protein
MMTSMLVPPDVRELHSPFLLLWRSWEQIQVLESMIARWIHGGGFRFERSTDEDGVLHATLRFNELPSEWSLLISEAVHSMRASLDHLVFGLARLAQGRPLTEAEARGCEFPIFGPRPMTEPERTRKIGLLAPESQQVIATVQPSEREDFAATKLWVLHGLDNRIKHRVIEPALVAYSAFMPQFMLVGEVTMVTPNSPLHDGLEVFAGRPARPDERTDLVASMQVVFPWHDPLTDGTIAGVGVVRVLRDLHEFVRDVHYAAMGAAGHMVALPVSNAPLDAQESGLFPSGDEVL